MVNKKGQKVPFKLNPQQLTFLKGIDKYNIILKSRQQGLTTAAASLSLFYAMTTSNTTCLLLSYSIDSATGIFQKLKQLYYDLATPIREQNPLLANNKKELMFLNGSRIIVATCGNKDVARGLTIRFAHLSEVAFMKDTVDKQLLAIEQALTPNGQIVLESTANGLNYFSELWGKSERKQTLYKNFFFGVFEDKIMFADEYKQFAERYIDLYGEQLTENEFDDIEKTLYKQGASIEQLMWRRLKIANSSLEAFQQEYPSNSVEAFISTGSNIFKPVLVHNRLEHIDDAKTVPVPKDLPDSLKQHYNRHFKLWDNVSPTGVYYVGVDSAEGISKDSSAIEVVSKEGYQIAEFSSKTIKPHDFAVLVRDIGYYFNNALIIIEKASSGHVVLDKMRNQYQYANLYKGVEYDKKGNKRKRAGFTTTSSSKHLLIQNFVEQFEKNQICINSKELLKQMKLFIRHDDGSMKAAAGEHDDLVMAMAFALYAIKTGKHYYMNGVKRYDDE